MRILISAVGRLRDAPSRTMFAEYTNRIAWPLTLREVEVKRAMPAAQARNEEARLLLETIADRATLVVLDEHGGDWSSAEFARRIAGWRDEGVGELAFAIGGADGHGDAVIARAAASVAFGRMTWPHRLARVMLAEQIYRAQQILAGHPYHRE